MRYLLRGNAACRRCKIVSCANNAHSAFHMTTPLPSRAISSHHVVALDSGWQLADSPPSSFNIEQINTASLQWRDAIVPGTVAQSIHDDINLPGYYDRCDWWYRTSFAAPNSHANSATRHRLRFDGLATLADVWLNGEKILATSNMFCADVVDVTQHLREHNDLVIHFHSLHAALEQKKPRPRWKTALTNHQNLRWFRTTLLGRIPAWSPPIEPVGPWRPISLESVSAVDCAQLDIQTQLVGDNGIVRAHAVLHAIDKIPTRAELVVADQRYALQLSANASAITLRGDIEIANAPKWWPNTHGEQSLLACHIEVMIGNEVVKIDCGRIGFKSIHVNRNNDAVSFEINGVPIFCRGAVWTVNDFLTLTGNIDSLRCALERARDANINMLRIGGTMIYERKEFFDLCDEFGIMVWQDFMFANMDYPVADENFSANITREIRQHLNTLQKHVCVSAYCAGSEIEQQAAMMGLPASEWSNTFFTEQLPALCAENHAGIPYFRGSPSEGPLPFHVDTGIAHYYGVGAYRRSLSDVKNANVKFASECLGFSNVPESETMALLLDGKVPVPHHPRWKARVPRDNGSGYDFEDIRDFYLKQLFHLDPVELRSQDVARYYALSRVVTGEVMKAVFAEWRRTHSHCGGGLIWFYQDLWPGAGWGIIDSENRPKPTYHYLRRAWAPRAILITDEGLDGLQLHAINESADALTARVEIELLQAGKIRIAQAEKIVELAPRSTQALCADEMIGHFTDMTYSYRFGPPKHDTVIARLICVSTGNTLSEDFYFPQGLNLPIHHETTIDSDAEFDESGNVLLRLRSNIFLQSVGLSATGFTPDSNYFHLSPNRERAIRFVANTPSSKFKIEISALNLSESITVRCEKK